MLIICWQIWKSRNSEAELQGLVSFGRTTKLIIRYDIFNTEVNGALAIHVIPHNSPMQNWNSYNFGHASDVYIIDLIERWCLNQGIPL